MKFRSTWELVRRWWRMVALYMAVGAVASLVVSALTTPIYVASTTLVVTQNAAAPDATDYTSLLGDEQLANTYSELLHSHPLLKNVVTSLGLKMSVQELAKKIKTNVIDNTQLITLKVEASSQERAVAIANELVKQFSDEIAARRNDQFATAKSNLQQQLGKVQDEMNATQAQITQLSAKVGEEDEARKGQLGGLLKQYTAAYGSLLKSYQDIRLAEAQFASSLVTAEAHADSAPLRPQPVMDMFFAALVGLVLSLGVALIVERLDDSLKSPEDITGALKLTTLGIVTRTDDLAVLNPFASLANPRHSIVEAFRMLRTNLEFSQLDHQLRTLLVTSANQGDGKSTAAVNIAVSLAQNGKRVILVDTNLSAPSLHTYFNLLIPATRFGLTTKLLAGRGSAGDYLQETGIERLRFLPCGPLPPNSAELLQSGRMGELIDELKTQADLVIFDTPALSGAADAALLAARCDAVLLVAKSGATRGGALRSAKEQLTQVGARVLGVLLNYVPTTHTNNYYYYGGYDSDTLSPSAHKHRSGVARQHDESPTAGEHVHSTELGKHENSALGVGAQQSEAQSRAPISATLGSNGGSAFAAKLKHLSGLSLIYVIADVINRGSALLLVPIYTHFMAPNEYGILALASLISSLLVMLLSFGGTSTVQRFYHQYSDEHSRAQFLGSFWLFLIVVPGVIIGGLLLFTDSIFGVVFNSLPLHPYIELILCIAYLNIAFGTVLQSLFRVREQAMRYLVLSVATMLLMVAFTIYLVVIEGRGAAGALGAQFVALDIMSLVSAAILLRELSKGWQSAKVASDSGQELPRALKYGLPLIPHFAAHWTLSISDRAILERFVGLGSVGLYSLAYQFGTVLQLLLTSVNQALTPAFSRAARDRSEFAMLGRLTTYYYFAVAVLGLVIALTAKDVIMLVTPPAYHEAGALVPYIVLGVVAMGFYFIPMNALSMTAGKTNFIPFITITAGALNLILNVILVPRFGPLAAAIDTAVGYGLLAVLTTLYARSVIPLKFEVARIIKIAIGSLAVYGVHFFVDTDNPLINLPVSLGLVSCLPLVLTLLGFWTASERARLARLLHLRVAPIRTIIPES